MIAIANNLRLGVLKAVQYSERLSWWKNFVMLAGESQELLRVGWEDVSVCSYGVMKYFKTKNILFCFDIFCRKNCFQWTRQAYVRPWCCSGRSTFQKSLVPTTLPVFFISNLRLASCSYSIVYYDWIYILQQGTETRWWWWMWVSQRDIKARHDKRGYAGARTHVDRRDADGQVGVSVHFCSV